MSTTPEKTTTPPLIARHFESSRHHRDNVIAAFEHALPVIRRRPAQEPTPPHAALAPGHRRRAVS